MTNETFSCFGERRSFSIEARLIEDPNPTDASHEDVWSYGELRLFVRGRCLTRHAAPNGYRDEVRWYLAPLLRWLERAWLPLFHEQRFPLPVGLHDHTIVRFEQAERRLLDEDTAGASTRRTAMQEWRKRHALWTGAAGGIFPNLWLRRQSDLCEISYDPGTPVGAPPGFEFQFSRGAAMLDAGIVSNALFEFRRWGEARNPGGVTAISTSSTFLREAEDWMIGPHLAGILERAQIPPPPMANGVLYPSSPEVAMFGTLTPDLVERDALILLETLARARCTHADPPVLSALVEDIAPPTRETSWSQGYDCALRTLDGIEVTPQHFVDVEQILCSLEIAIESRSISDASLRGVAIAGIVFRPTFVINEFCEKNKTAPGRRFTLAHELCHILFDRDRARRVTHSSSPWAPEPIERRANAFAAMFLMPYRLIDAALAEVGPINNSSKLNRLAQRLRCGRRALLEHLKNIDRIDQAVFYRLSMAH